MSLCTRWTCVNTKLPTVGCHIWTIRQSKHGPSSSRRVLRKLAQDQSVAAAVTLRQSGVPVPSSGRVPSHSILVVLEARGNKHASVHRRVPLVASATHGFQLPTRYIEASWRPPRCLEAVNGAPNSVTRFLVSNSVTRCNVRLQPSPWLGVGKRRPSRVRELRDDLNYACFTSFNVRSCVFLFDWNKLPRISTHLQWFLPNAYRVLSSPILSPSGPRKRGYAPLKEFGCILCITVHESYYGQ